VTAATTEVDHNHSKDMLDSCTWAAAAGETAGCVLVKLPLGSKFCVGGGPVDAVSRPAASGRDKA
jgi:hypothetical protein